MQPKDIISGLENLATPSMLITYPPSCVLEVNNKSVYDIPGLFKLGVPDISNNTYISRSLKFNIFHTFRNGSTISLCVESRYVLVPNYFTLGRGVVFAHCNGVVIPVAVIAKNKRTKEYGLYINTDFLESSSHLRALSREFNKFKLDWILAGYGLLTKKEIEKCFITPNIPIFKTIKEMKYWEDKMKEDLYNDALAS